MRNPRFVTVKLVAALSLALCTNAAQAGGPGSVSAGVVGGTLGFGPELSYRLGPFGARANAGFLGFEHSQELDGIDYNGDVHLLNAGAMADWYPFFVGFRISAGARWNGNRIDLSAQPRSAVDIGGTTYMPAEIGRLRGTVDANPVAPVVSIGFAGDLMPLLTVSAELGVMYHGAPQVSDLRASGLLANDPSLESDLKAEARRIEREMDSYRVWPIAQLFVTYQF